MADLIPRRAVAPGLEHVTVGTTAFAAAFAFYDPVCRTAGLDLIDELVDEEEDAPQVEAAAWAPPGAPACLWLVTAPADTSGLHVRFRVPGRADVERVYRVALDCGGTEHAAPRRWTIYRAGEFTATVRDVAGNLLEFLADE